MIINALLFTMSKQSSDHLFDLIKSLTKSEKRYFRLFSQQQNESKAKYMQLFDFLEQKENYLAADLEGITFIKASQISNMKAHLIQKILQALIFLRQLKVRKIVRFTSRDDRLCANIVQQRSFPTSL